MRLYICYAHYDRLHIRKLADAARGVGFDSIYEQILHEDFTWPEQIAHTVFGADVFLFTMSSHSLADDWCLWELALAVDYHKPIIPVLLEAKLPPTTPLMQYPYAEFTDPAAPESQARLVQGLQSVRVFITKADLPPAPESPVGLPAHVLTTTTGNEAARTQASRGTLAKSFVDRARNRPAHDVEGRLADYNEAIRIDPKFAEAYARRGANRSILGDFDGAMEDYNQAIRIQPTLSYAHHNRGLAYEEMKKIKEALADYAEAIRHTPDYIDAYNSRGNLLYNEGHYEAAIADYDRIIELSPKQPVPYYNRGNAKEKLGDLAGAIQDWSRYLHLGGASETADPSSIEKRISDVKKKLRTLQS